MTGTNANPGGSPRRWGRRLGLLVLGVGAGFVVSALGANLLIRKIARPHLHASASEVAATFAIVPGASVYRDGRPSPQLEDRLVAALALLRGGRVERILVSGARDRAYDEAGPMRHWLTQRGVPAATVIEDHAGYRTLDTMERAARVYGIRQAVICTQSFHLPRAVFLARRAGIAAVGLAADGPIRRSSASDTVRESLASLMAVVDSYLLSRQPREPGGPPPG